MKKESILLFLLTCTLVATLVNGEGFGSSTMVSFFLFVISGCIFSFVANTLSIRSHNISAFKGVSVPLLFLLGIYIFFSILITDNHLNSYAYYFVTLILLLVSTVIVFRNASKTIFHFNKVILALALGESILCVVQFFGFVNSNNFLFKVTGSLVNPNVTAMFLALCFPIVVYTFFESKGNFKKIAFLTLGFASFALIALKCRSAIIGVLFSTAILLYFKYDIISKLRSSIRGYKLILFVIVLTGLTTFLSVTFYSAKQESSNGRKFVWKLSAGLIKQHPITGIGYGKFELGYNLEQAKYFSAGNGSPSEIRNASYIHTAYNEYLQNAVEGGLTGLALFTCFLFFILRQSFQNYKKSDKSLLGLSLFSGICSFTVMSFLNFTIRAIPVMVLFIVYVAILESMPSGIKADKSRDKTLFKLQPLLQCLFILIPVIVGSIEIYRANTFFKNEQAYDLIKERRYADAINTLSLLGNTLEDENAYWVNFGTALYSNKKYPQALEKFQTAVSLRPYPGSFLYIGNCYQHMKQYEKAIENYSMARDIIPNRILPNYSLMKTYVNMNDSINASAMAIVIIQMKPKGISEKAFKYKTEAKLLLSKFNKNHEDEIN